MQTYIAKRLLLIIPTLLGAAALVFVIMRVIPGDVALLIFGGDQAGHIDPKQLEAMRHRLGLDQSLLAQFGTWLWGVVRFDFGNSLWTGRPVVEELLIRLPLSLELALAATIVSVVIAVPFGVLEVLREDYIRTAWAKGLRERAVVLRHALKNSMLPVITLIGTEFAFLIGGLVVTETVFTLNGVGRFVVDAVAHRDYPVVQALIFLIAFSFVIVNLLVDLTYAWFDPRIRYR